MPFSDHIKDAQLKLTILVVLGAYSWLKILFFRLNKIHWGFASYLIAALVVLLIMIGCLSSGYKNIAGIYFSQISVVPLLAIIGIALNSSFLKPQFIAKGVFVSSALVAFLAFPYDMLRYHELIIGRLNGTLAQSNILAVYISAGLIIGFYWLVTNTYKDKKYILVAVEAYMLFMVVLTQTRFIVILLSLMALTYFALSAKKDKKLVVIAIATILFVIGSVFVANNRQIGPKAIDNSISYRLHLQSKAFSGDSIKPIQHNGTDRLMNKLDCKNLRQSNDLSKTCDRGFIFTSYHNQFIDRTVQFGWLTGIIYIAVVALGLVEFYRQRKTGVLLALGSAFLLIVLYYFTNITSIELELLLWLLLAKGLSKRLLKN
ncbi:hypothetical protein EBZ57_03380 [bacterium]|nr:hypothetical protein [bacterium]